VQREAVTQIVDMLKSFTGAMLQAGVNKSVIQAAANWFDAVIVAGKGKTPNEKQAHSYSLGTFGLQDDQVTRSFCNAMQRAHASPSDVSRMLDWHLTYESKLQRSTSRPTHQPAEQDFSKQDAQDRQHCESVLKEIWGQAYTDNLRIIARYIAAMPKKPRDYLETSVTPSGGLLLNNVDMLEALLVDANSGDFGPFANEIAALEQRMKTDRKNYFRDEAAQTRYRNLIKKRDGG